MEQFKKNIVVLEKPKVWEKIKAWLGGKKIPKPKPFLVYMIGSEKRGNKGKQFIDENGHIYKIGRKEINLPIELFMGKGLVGGYEAFLEPREGIENGVFEVPEGTTYYTEEGSKKIRCCTLIYKRKWITQP